MIDFSLGQMLKKSALAFGLSWNDSFYSHRLGHRTALVVLRTAVEEGVSGLAEDTV
jgi:hypothetical protein